MFWMYINWLIFNYFLFNDATQTGLFFELQDNLKQSSSGEAILKSVVAFKKITSCLHNFALRENTM